MVSPQTKHLPYLDGLRGIAAIVVVIFHEEFFSRINNLPFCVSLFPHGFLAVDLFLS
jgi:peptidoglycan/LPS O-acetylase OafA/YrhL